MASTKCGCCGAPHQDSIEAMQEALQLIAECKHPLEHADYKGLLRCLQAEARKALLGTNIRS